MFDGCNDCVDDGEIEMVASPAKAAAEQGRAMTTLASERQRQLTIRPNTYLLTAEDLKGESQAMLGNAIG